MKKNKKYCILVTLVLLLLSCSLLEPLPQPNTRQSSSQISKPELLAQPVLDHDILRCVVSTGYEEGRVNLRAGAGITFNVLLVLEEGRELYILETGDWLKVKTSDDIAGYINSRYCILGE